jgi:hypothetical protein
MGFKVIAVCRSTTGKSISDVENTEVEREREIYAKRSCVDLKRVVMGRAILK